MFNVAYGLGCDSNDDPTLVRMQKLLKAVSRAAMPAQFAAVSNLFCYTRDENLNLSIC
jgi:hypothetical protein